jgi:hypothetical protein
MTGFCVPPWPSTKPLTAESDSLSFMRTASRPMTSGVISSVMPVGLKRVEMMRLPLWRFACWMGTSSPVLMVAFCPCVARMFGSPSTSTRPLLLSVRSA